MTQGDLFADAVSGELRLAPPCAYGVPTLWGSVYAPGWAGPHHCAKCAEAVERACREFAAAVAAGEFDERGYTPAERRAAMTSAASSTTTNVPHLNMRPSCVRALSRSAPCANACGC